MPSRTFHELMAGSSAARNRQELLLDTDARLIRAGEPPRPATEAELRSLQQQMQAPIAIDGCQRCWFLDESPQCDALLTLARLLDILSFPDRSAF
jgi:hypothetical protein